MDVPAPILAPDPQGLGPHHAASPDGSLMLKTTKPGGGAGEPRGPPAAGSPGKPGEDRHVRTCGSSAVGALSSGGTCSVPSSLSPSGWGAFYHQFLRKHNLLVMFAGLGNVNMLYQKNKISEK